MDFTFKYFERIEYQIWQFMQGTNLFRYINYSLCVLIVLKLCIKISKQRVTVIIKDTVSLHSLLAQIH